MTLGDMGYTGRLIGTPAYSAKKVASLVVASIHPNSREDIRLGSLVGRVADLRLLGYMLFITIEMGRQVAAVVGVLILARHDKAVTTQID
jgi:hypothetical protein